MVKLKLLLALLLFSALTNAQERFNGTFEKLDQQGNPVGWDLTYNGKNKFEIKLDSAVKKQGKYAISISSVPGFPSGAIQFPINQSFQGGSLMLIGNIKTENVTDGFAGVWLRVEDANGNDLAFETMENQKLTGSTDWKEYMVSVKYNSDEAVKITAGAMLLGKGKIWVDSLRLYVDETQIEQATIKSAPNYPALKDKEFENGSGIDTIITGKVQLKYLTLLGELWGFLKYHHPAIAAGERNWDAELLRVLPKVLQLKTDETASILFESWVNDLGKVPDCKDCIPTNQLKDLVVKPDYGSLLSNSTFSKSLKKKLTHLISNSNNKSHYYVDFGGGTIPAFTHEQPYTRWDYPDVGYRLLALYRYWGIIQYFSPNRKLAQDWNNTLAIFIPQIIAARNQYKYVNTLVRLVSTIRDTHAFISSNVYQHYLGRYKLPFQAKFIADQLVVTGYYKDTLNVTQQLKIGDVITSINGKTVKELVKDHVPVTSASNLPTVLRDMPGLYLLRSHEPVFKLEISRAGQFLTVDQEGPLNDKFDSYSKDWDPKPKAPGFELLSKDIGYIYCKTFKATELDQIREQFKNTAGIIIDMRNYPTDEMGYSLSTYLKPNPSPFVRFSQGSISRPGSFRYGPPVISGSKTEDYYKGKVVVIVNEMTQSNAEFVTMAFQTAPNVKVIGSTTAGADGNIVSIPLPGGFKTFISGIGVYYPDGFNAQGTGVKIDYVVKPTLNGVKNGADELLEAAKQHILN